MVGIIRVYRIKKINEKAWSIIMRNRTIGSHPAIGIRPIIDARRGALGVRESLEEQTMNMAKSAKNTVSVMMKSGRK